MQPSMNLRQLQQHNGRVLLEVKMWGEAPRGADRPNGWSRERKLKALMRPIKHSSARPGGGERRVKLVISN